MNTTRFFQLGYLLPRILVLLFFADLALRLAPLGWLAFRAQEAMQRSLPSAMGPFRPNSRFASPRTYGDLSSMGNFPALREYRREEFVTDSRGFHNSPLTSEAPEGLFLGDSFAVASDSVGDNTLPGKLAALRHKPVYNAGGGEPLNLATIRLLSRQLGMAKGYVVYEFLERHLSESPLLHTETGRQGLRASLPAALGPVRWDTWRLPYWHFIRFSPLKAVAQRIDKKFANGILLPNHYARNVLTRTLTNGDTMLFFASDVRDGDVENSRLQAWVSYWSWLSEALAKDNLTLLVLLVPDKYTVYQPWFAPPETELPDRQHLLELEESLKQNKVAVVNLVEVFRREAAAEIARHRYIYWKDDSHWNDLGISIAADEIDRSLKSLRFDPAASH